MYMANMNNDIASANNEADYKEEVLARETATSAYNIVVGKVKRNFDSYRSSMSDLDYGKAKYDISATDAEDGSVTVVAVGKYGGHEYEIVGSVSKTGSTTLDAVTIVSKINSVFFKGDYMIDGGTEAHAVRTIWSETANVFNEAISAEQVKGMAGTADVIHDELAMSIPLLRAKIQSYSGPNLISLSFGKKDNMEKWWKDEIKDGNSSPAGTSGSPVVIIVKDNVVLEADFMGYGILFVEGDLTLKKDATWNGLVYMAGEDSEFEMSNNSRINGALVIDGADTPKEDKKSKDSSDQGLLGGHFDVDVFDTPGSTREIYHQHAYDDKYDTNELDMLSAGCKNGGLCWGQVFGAGAPSEIEIISMNNHMADGTYEIQVGSTVYSGDLSTPFSITADPADITKFMFTFDTLCALVPSSPSDVQDKAEDRNSALTVRLKDTSASKYVAGDPSNLDSKSGLVYEVSVYHHAKKGETCSGGTLIELDELWANPSGDTYSGADETCISEDLNDDLYTDANQRSKKWGTRKYQPAKKGKKSEKFWMPTGECGVAEDGKKKKKGKAKVQFAMGDDAEIVFNSAALKRLKDMVSELEIESSMPSAKRISAVSKTRNVDIKMDGTIVSRQ